MEQIIILGLGNVLYADEGFGVRAAEQLYTEWEFPEHVEIVDGGTQGHTLLGVVEKADKLLVLDAVDFGLPPGTLVRREGTQIPAWLNGQKVSPHQNSFAEVLALSQLRGTLPGQMVLIGVHPTRLALDTRLSDTIQDMLAPALDLALQQLWAWGVKPRPFARAQHLHHPCLAVS